MSTTTLIQQQHEIIRRSRSTINEYEKAKADTEARFKQTKLDAEARFKREKEAVEAARRNASSKAEGFVKWFVGIVLALTQICEMMSYYSLFLLLHVSHLLALMMILKTWASSCENLFLSI